MAKCTAAASGIILVLPLVMVAQGIPLNCSTQFRAALHQVIELRKTCGEAVYRDCCEVSTHNMYACTSHIYVKTTYMEL